MRPAEIEVRFFQTYYFANVAKNILSDQFAYIRHLNDFYGDGREVSFAKPFPRFSALHAFLEFIVDDLLFDTNDIELTRRQREDEQFTHIPQGMVPNPIRFPVNDALLYYGIEHISFEAWLKDADKNFAAVDDDDVYEYYGELRLEGSFQELVDRAVDEVFFVLFSNRSLLLNFNEMMSRQINGIDLDEVPEESVGYFARSGVLCRVGIPQWAKDAVYFRDRGRCVFCRCDLSGLITIGSDKNFDHVVPLAQGGLNDVTNLQLLCDACNLRKGAGDALTSDFYQAWYDLKSPHGE